MKQRQTIMEMQPEQRPDEKFLAFGASALTDAELLAIILRTGSAEETSVELADRILQLSPDGGKSILNIFRSDMEDLRKIRGVGRVKALQIKALGELSRRIAMSSARPQLDFCEPKTIAQYYMEQFRHEKKESVLLLMLDSACHLIREQVISVGTVNSALLSPREIFLEAVKAGAVNIILLHNHPSGDPTPSASDLLTTRRIKRCGQLLEITLIDHLILGDRRYYSMNIEGLLEADGDDLFCSGEEEEAEEEPDED